MDGDGLGVVSVCPGCGLVREAYRDGEAEEIRIAYTGPAGDGATLRRVDAATLGMYVPCERCLTGTPGGPGGAVR